jgi:hypothetical protein
VIEPLLAMNPWKHFITADDVNQNPPKGISALEAGNLTNCWLQEIEPHHSLRVLDTCQGNKTQEIKPLQFINKSILSRLKQYTGVT